MIIKGNLVDIFQKKISHVALHITNGRVSKLEQLEGEADQFILPGFVDAHVHIESSMLVPSEFAKLAVLHGTVATVSDPHEIANVMGAEGVKYMIDNGNTVPLKFNFGVPSCVPATDFETAGATLSVADVEALLKMPEVRYLAEMMNYPGVLMNAPDVMAKIEAAKAVNKPIDGHAPGLRGEEAKRYIAAGISTDHECFTYEEGLEKLKLGMKIIIREGSAAKNFEALIPLLPAFPEKIMFCSDDKHPDDLIVGHINQLVVRAIKAGYELFDVLRAACINPVEHYKLPVGALRDGDPADFIIVKDLVDFEVMQTYIDGNIVAANGESFIQTTTPEIINHFHTNPQTPKDFEIAASGSKLNLIKALDGALITEKEEALAKIVEGLAIADTERDILKIAVLNRYQAQAPALAFIRGFGLKAGAIASCVGHDSHNILAIGTNDEDLCKAINLVIAARGGISVVNGEVSKVLPLPIAGIMSDKPGEAVGQAYAELDRYAKEALGSTLSAPFMTLSFMALLVIPRLKLSDKGLFDGKTFTFIPLFINS